MDYIPTLDTYLGELLHVTLSKRCNICWDGKLLSSELFEHLESEEFVNQATCTFIAAATEDDIRNDLDATIREDFGNHVRRIAFTEGFLRVLL